MVVARSTGLPVGMAVQRLGMGLCSLVVALLLMVALFATGSHGQSAHLSAPTFGSSPSGNVFVTYFGDNQNTTATGATSTLPQCTGGNIGQSNLFLRLENTDTGVVLQQVGPFTGITGFLWNTTAIATLTPSFTGLYVCRLYQNSGLLATSTLSYQLNVVVPMSITCQYPPNLRYESLNVLSCNVTGYPLPSITWTQVNGSNTTASWTLNGGIYQVTSTMSFLGNQTRLAAGLLFTISTTAKYPTFNCTPLQTPTAMNICDSTNTSVTVTSEPLQIVAPCPATVFKNTFLSPATPPSTEFGTTFNISCPAGYNNTSNISSLRCQAIGHWTTFPTCAEINECDSMPCMNNGTCTDEVNNFTCACVRGYTQPTCSTYEACLLDPCNDTSSTCMNKENRGHDCVCPAGTTGVGDMEGGCMTVPPSTETSTPTVTTIVTSSNAALSSMSTSVATMITSPTSVPTTTTDPKFPIWIIIVIVVSVVVLLLGISGGVFYYVKYKGDTTDKGPSPEGNQVAETDGQYDTCVHNDDRPPQVTDPSADPDHYDTFVRPEQQGLGTASSTRPDTYDHIVLNKSIPAEGETYDHLNREQVLAITQGKQPGQQSAAATALSTQQPANPRVDTSYSMVDMSKKSSRPLLV